MIGSGLKKLAKENNMKIAKGVAYGNLGGFAATMHEGSGWKLIVFSTVFPDPAGKGQLVDLVSSTELKKQFRVLDLSIQPKSIHVQFHDNPGTMGKIREFLAWFLPLLRQYGATGADTCVECGGQLQAGRWMLINGVAYHLHETCAQRAQDQVEGANTRRKEEDNGNYLTGLLGALLGAAIGAVAWAAVLYMGYVASLVGLLIGFLALKGYDLLKGKQGKGKVPILIVAVILGVVLGTLGAYGYSVVELIADGELPGFVAADTPMILLLMLEDPEFKSSVISNIVQGLLFAALGVFALLRQAGKAVADETCTVLE